MKLKLSLHKSGYLFFPKDLREMFGIDPEDKEKKGTIDIEALVNAKTLVIYKAGEDLDSVSKSLSVVQQDIDLRRGTTVLKLMPTVEVEDREDRFVFVKENRRIAVLKSDIQTMLGKHSVDEASRTLTTKLTANGMDVELGRVREVVARVVE